MNLAQTRIGQVVTVEHVAGEGSFRRRLMELGLVPGTRVEVIGVAPLGDPLELLVRGGSISIRRAEAEGVSVNLGEATSSQRATEGRAEGASLTQRAQRAARGFARSAP
jgi:ferrous iron transport protein A